MPTASGGGPLGDPLAGLVMPPGDPGPLLAAAGRLTAWATMLGTGAAGHRRAALSVVGSDWIGPAATKSATTIDALASAASYLADGADHASSTLATCAKRWGDAQALWQRAQHLAADALADEEAHRRAAAAAPPVVTANSGALAQARAGVASTGDYASPLRQQARVLGEQAVNDATRAISGAVTALSPITASVAVLGPDPAAYFATNLNATVTEINEMTIAQRVAFVKNFEDGWGARFGSQKMFTNIEGVLHLFADEGAGKPGDWVSWVDATILFGFERGMATTIGRPALPGPQEDPGGVAAWKDYFVYMQGVGEGRVPLSTEEQYRLWALGEEASTHTGYSIAGTHGQRENVPDYLFANLGAEAYRQAMLNLGTAKKGASVLGFLGGAPLGPLGTIGGAYLGPKILSEILNPQNSGPTYYGGHVAYGFGQTIQGTGQVADGIIHADGGEIWSGLTNDFNGTVGVIHYGVEGAGDVIKTGAEGAYHEAQHLISNLKFWE